MDDPRKNNWRDRTCLTIWKCLAAYAMPEHGLRFFWSFDLRYHTHASQPFPFPKTSSTYDSSEDSPTIDFLLAASRCVLYYCINYQLPRFSVRTNFRMERTEAGLNSLNNHLAENMWRRKSCRLSDSEFRYENLGRKQSIFCQHTVSFQLHKPSWQTSCQILRLVTL